MEDNKVKNEEESCETAIDGEEDIDSKENEEKAESFDIIESDYERLRGIAERKGVDVGALITAIEQSDIDERRQSLSVSCSDPELVEHILSLEAQLKCGGRSDMAELSALFPEIKEASQLPTAVIKASKLRGSTLLDEYLRYQIKSRRAAEAKALAQSKAAQNSIGSQRNASASELDPSAAEFIKALWGR